ncbi:hypothetical protein CHS0354_038666 [Potamilus streckersoni]|uniref:Peroxidase n=1 Tax=Potamilus streckersoni TaxID=2493646 RepID=A0AAE0T8K0_9BIVA|nr:hypothetical protein CHS0354_038666 [Potamilus streckersoni]
MGKRLIHRKFLSILGVLVLLACSQGQTLEQAIQPIENLDKTLFQRVDVTANEKIQKDVILSNIVSASLPSIELNIQSAVSQDKSFFDRGIDQVGVRNTDFFGPHLITSPQAIEIASVGELFSGVAKSAVEKLAISKENINQQLSSRTPISGLRCPFSNVPDCTAAATSRYRTIDGSCNNLNNKLWGRSFTPFERMLPALYDNGIDEPRQTSLFGGPLPLARKISSQFHQPSLIGHLMPDLSHMTMEFGQFLSHDIQRNALSTGYAGSSLTCCGSTGPISRPNCFAIEIPTDDPYYSQFNRTCLNFVRALPTPKLDCSLGQRQQLNQNTHYIDGSQIYGSDEQTSNSLRTFTGGKLQTGADPTIPNLLPKDTANAANCILPASNANVKCFLAGDVRVNQHPALISLHTIFMREHNRIAAGLEALNNGWSDQIIYDEARKIVGAMLQHITYKEYLPEILGDAIMNTYGLKPLTSGYFNGYKSSVNPAIKNEFSAAAFRFGHSMVHDSLKYNNGEQYFKDVFLNPSTLYDTSGGVNSITKGLTESNSQKVDERLSSQITRHLFERQPGFGGDLVAINIQRGRDHGIPFYQLIKTVCNVSGNVHEPSVWTALNGLYQSPFDIDLYSAGVSEKPISASKIGPTFACIIAKQFEALKKGDRYYYENSGDQAFTLEQLVEIRKTTLSRIVCRNTGITSIPTKAFIKNISATNPTMSCSGVSAIDYNKWKCGWSDWGPWTPCVNFIQFRLRTCRQQKPCAADVCTGDAFEVQMCGSVSDVDLPRIKAEIQSFRSILDTQHKLVGVVDLHTAQSALQNIASQHALQNVDVSLSAA